MSTNETRILSEFITNFLPPSTPHRCSNKNELEYLWLAIARIFSHYFQVTISEKSLLKAFEILGYKITTKRAVWDSDRKEYKASETGTEIREDAHYKDLSAAYIYINVNAYTVGQLRLVTAGLPPNTHFARIQEKRELISRIELFRRRMNKQQPK